MDPLEQVDFGQKLQETDVVRGLRELCPDLVFDVATNFGLVHPYQNRLMGVFYRERHICSMDRGIIPEITVWANFKKLVEIPWYQADRDDAAIQFVQILPENTPDFQDLWITAEKETDPSLHIKDNKLYRLKVTGYESVGKRCLRVGWRHTFAKLLRAQVPGVTRESLARKFNLDVNKLGTLEEDGVEVEKEPQAWAQQ